MIYYFLVKVLKLRNNLAFILFQVKDQCYGKIKVFGQSSGLKSLGLKVSNIFDKPILVL